MLIIDGHADTLYEILDEGRTLTSTENGFNLKDAFSIAPYIQNFAVYISPKYVEENKAFKRANSIIDKFYTEYSKNRDKLILIKSKSDFKRVIVEKRVGVILSIENGSAIEGNLDNINYFFNKGIRICSITWNIDNDLGCGAKTKNDTGLTNLGKDYIKRLNEKNIIVDVSHISEKGFYDVLDVSDKTIIATHSCARKLCDNVRNLTDNQIKRIAERSGTIGVVFYNEFLSRKGTSTVEDIANHIEYIAELVGIDYVALGTDFQEREKCPNGIYGVLDFAKIFDSLRNRGFKEEDIEKVAGKNFARVLFDNI